MDYDTFETPLRQLTILKDPPLDKVDDVWKLRASVDAFVNLGHLIGEVHLERLKAAATEVFGKLIPPPKPDELFRPSGSQDEFHSSWLRESILKSPVSSSLMTAVSCSFIFALSNVDAGRDDIVSTKQRWSARQCLDEKPTASVWCPTLGAKNKSAYEFSRFRGYP